MWIRRITVAVALLAAPSFCPHAACAGDQLGLYFDAAATVQCQVSMIAVPETLYIVLKDPTFERVYGWEAAVQSASGFLFVVPSSLPSGGTVTSTGAEFRVTYSNPLVVGPRTVLATLAVMSFSAETCLILTGASSPSLPVPGPIIWPSADAPTEIATADALASGVDAIMGGCTTIPEFPGPCHGAVADLRPSWGALKSMYR